MLIKDAPMYKALYFDLNTEKLRQYYSNTSPNGSYEKIFNFMKKHNFEHEQGSGYHSKHETTDVHIFDVIHVMQETLPWFGSCVSKFEVANLTDHYDLMQVISKPDVKKCLQTT